MCGQAKVILWLGGSDGERVDGVLVARAGWGSVTQGVQKWNLILQTGFAITMLVIGTFSLGQCPIEPRLPGFLMISGIIHLNILMLESVKLKKSKPLGCLKFLFTLFFYCWTITGSIWVLQIYQVNPRDCDDTAYYFAVVDFITAYTVGFIMLVWRYFCCGPCKNAMTERNITEAEKNNEAKTNASKEEEELENGASKESSPC